MELTKTNLYSNRFACDGQSALTSDCVAQPYAESVSRLEGHKRVLDSGSHSCLLVTRARVDQDVCVCTTGTSGTDNGNMFVL